jgi:transcriptional antiterminator RfaH
MSQWYVVHTQPNNELKAVHHLQRQGFEVYLPKFLKRRKHARRTDWIATPLFQRYLFVKIDLEKARWRAIRSTIGVSALVCQGDAPAPLPAMIIDEIRAREDEAGMVSLNGSEQFCKGQKVQIVSGAFCDQVGLFEFTSSEERAVVLLQLLGRQVRAQVPLAAVDAYA